MGLFWNGYLAGIVSALLPSVLLLAWHVSRAGDAEGETPSDPALERRL